MKQESKNKSEQNKKANDFYQTTRLSDREQRYSEKDKDKSYSYFVKNSNSIPEYIKNNLKNMPGNKGYFWKGIAFYGELPREIGSNTTLFEKKHGGLLVIHEWTPYCYDVYHKKDKYRKILLSSEPRKVFRGSILF